MTKIIDRVEIVYKKNVKSGFGTKAQNICHAAKISSDGVYDIVEYKDSYHVKYSYEDLAVFNTSSSSNSIDDSRLAFENLTEQEKQELIKIIKSSLLVSYYQFLNNEDKQKVNEMKAKTGLSWSVFNRYALRLI